MSYREGIESSSAFALNVVASLSRCTTVITVVLTSPTDTSVLEEHTKFCIHLEIFHPSTAVGQNGDIERL